MLIEGPSPMINPPEQPTFFDRSSIRGPFKLVTKLTQKRITKYTKRKVKISSVVPNISVPADERAFGTSAWSNQD